MEEQPTPRFETKLITRVKPDGTMEAYEVVIVPLWVSLRVRFLFKVRAVFVSAVEFMLTSLERLTDIVDRVTLKYIPPELIDTTNGKDKP